MSDETIDPLAPARDAARAANVAPAQATGRLARAFYASRAADSALRAAEDRIAAERAAAHAI